MQNNSVSEKLRSCVIHSTAAMAAGMMALSMVSCAKTQPKDEKTGGYLAVYIAGYEPDMGAEFAQFPSKEYTDTYRTDVLYYALSKDGVNFEAMNNNKAVLSPEGCLKLGSPSIFRKPDGTYGLIASLDNITDKIIVFDSDDLLYYKNQRVFSLNDKGIAVKNPCAEYKGGSYKIYWEGSDGNSYVTKTKNFEKFSKPSKTTYSKEQVSAELPEYAVKSEASVFELTQEEYQRIYRKYSALHSVSVEVEDITVSEGQRISLPSKLNVVYSDGSKTPMGVTWDTSGIDLENPAKGSYRISGRIDVESYNSPLAEFRADPYAVYDEENDCYYFTGSNMNERSASGGGAYQSIVIRKSDTINGITDAEEFEIWTDRTLDNGIRITGWYWAPEIHKIGGKWRIIALASVKHNWEENASGRQCIFTCNGDDLTDPDNWEYTGYIREASNGLSVGAFDTTYFEYGGKSYYVTPNGSKIWITAMDPDNPIFLKGPMVLLSSADRGFETNNGSGKAGYNNMPEGMTGQAIEEASSVLIHDDKIFIAYAGCTIDMMYCVCLLYADLDSDLTDPASWTKYPYPILSTQDLTTTVKKADYTASDGTENVTGCGDSGLLEGCEGEYEGTFGPGHNSFTVDKNGNPVIIYHARDWKDSYPGAEGPNKYGLVDPGRHAYARHVIFNYEGFPVCNLTDEQYLSDSLKNVEITITVE